MGKYLNSLLEEELKLKVGNDFFKEFDTTKIIGKIDFCVAKTYLHEGQNELFDEHEDIAKELAATQSFLWAEAKKGDKQNIIHSFVQLILTIGRWRTYEKQLPPAYLGAFDAEKIAFIRYDIVAEVFAQNDFNWNVTPSNHDTKEFKQLLELVEAELETKSTVFDYLKQEKELRT